MAFFLKKSKLKKGVYLQIYESFYDPVRKATAHKSHRAVGYVHELIQAGIEDPIAHFQREVDLLNKQRRDKKVKERARQISESSPERFLGYFPLKNINDALGVKNDLDWLQLSTSFRFNIYEMLSALIYARVVHPCSKHKTFHEVLPRLYEPADFSFDQLLDGIEFIGSEYEKIIEIYNHRMRQRYPFDTSHAYFDCTNFYFEIDREDDLRRKGPSKERRLDPIVGMGLLLDANQIPIGMRLFPGNQSEKPVMREVIDNLKRRNNINGRTIRVADKGLNCANNIRHALECGDGYIMTKAIKTLSQTEKEWILLNRDYVPVTDADGSILYWIKECVDDFPYTILDNNGREVTVMLREKRVVTYNESLAKKRRAEIRKQANKALGHSLSQVKRSEFGDYAKYVVFESTDKQGQATGGKVAVRLNEDAIDLDSLLAGYNLFVTSEVDMPAAEIHATYRNLWRIEESFRVMKSDLEARPVYLQKADSIVGHFLICYLAVLLMRLFQFKILKNNFSSESLIGFFRKFRIVEISERRIMNLSLKTPFISALAEMTNLPLTSFNLTHGQVKDMLNHRF